MRHTKRFNARYISYISCYCLFVFVIFSVTYLTFNKIISIEVDISTLTFVAYYSIVLFINEWRLRVNVIKNV